MPRPRPSRRQQDARFAWAAQSLRLRGLASGEHEPLCLREALYLQLLRDNKRPRMSDFILSEPLFRLECIERAWQEEQAAEVSLNE